MVEQFLHGIEIVEIDDGVRPVTTVKSSVIMAFGTAPDADADVFPLNEPVLLLSQPRKAVGLGEEGTLKAAVDGIYDQDAAAVIICRVDEGADIYETWANLMGDVAAKTGVWAALGAKSAVHLTPKLLCAPGYTGQRITGATTNILVTAGGTNYTEAPTVHIYPADATIDVQYAADAGNTGDGTFALEATPYVSPVAPGVYEIECTTEAADGGTFTIKDPGGAVIGTVTVGVLHDGPIKFTIADGATDYALGDIFRVTVDIDGGTGAIAAAEANVDDGVVTGVNVTRAGFNYVLPPIVAFSGGGGSGAIATTTIGDGANPLVAEMLGVADRLRAIVVADGPNSTNEDAVTYREDWGSKRVYIVDPHALVFDTDLVTPISQPASARVCGLISRMDRQKGFWWSPSNQILNGVIGMARPIDFNISDPNTEANYLNEHEVATIIRHEGYRLWGNRTTASDPLWAFLPVRRTADMVYEAIEQSFLWALDRPLSANNILEIAESVNEYLRHLKAVGAILGGKSWIDPELNTPTELQAGKLYVSFDIEPPALLEHLIFHAHRNGSYYEEVIERVVRELAV